MSDNQEYLTTSLYAVLLRRDGAGEVAPAPEKNISPSIPIAVAAGMMPTQRQVFVTGDVIDPALDIRIPLSQIFA